MPTDAEWKELRINCTWTWTTLNGVKGYRVTSKKTGNSIFLPAAGCRYGTYLDYAGSIGHYWSSSLYTDYTDYPYNAFYMNFGSGGFGEGSVSRYDGFSVRPVSE